MEELVPEWGWGWRRELCWNHRICLCVIVVVLCRAAMQKSTSQTADVSTASSSSATSTPTRSILSKSWRGIKQRKSAPSSPAASSAAQSFWTPLVRLSRHSLNSANSFIGLTIQLGGRNVDKQVCFGCIKVTISYSLNVSSSHVAATVD